MSSSLDPAQSTTYPQQQDTSSKTTANTASNSGSLNGNSDNRLNHQIQDQQQQQQYQSHPYQHHPQQSYYYPQTDYSQPRQQQQQHALPRHPGISHTQAQAQQEQSYYQQDSQQRSDEYYRPEHSASTMSNQGKGQQQQYHQPSHYQYQPPPYQQQQRHPNINHQYQQHYQPSHPQHHQSLSSSSQQQQQQQHQQQQQQPQVQLVPQRDLNGNGVDAPLSIGSSASSVGHSQQGQSEQASASVSAASGSVERSTSPRSESESNLRFKVTLDAQTAAMQHQGDTPVTYLNKGQFYTISLQDTEEYDGDIHSVIKVTFHEEAHRKLAARYWSFWLSQQTNPKTARALDIEKASSTGMMEVHSKTFDRISFKWNGKAGAKLMVRFNCLSTDFSRIKGVKGIPLRVHMDTMLNGGTFSNNEQDQAVERSYAKIKLFRDKGAERKNKDDHKHLEKMWDKMRGKNADTNPLSQVLAPVQSVSVFWECLDHQQDSAEDETLDLSETLVHESLETNPNASGGGGESGRNESSSSLLTASSTVDSSSGAAGEPLISESNALVPASKKRRRANETIVISGGFNSTSGALERASHYSNGGGMSEGAPSSDQLLDRDPTYVPQIRKKKQPALCLYIKIGGEAVYRAVYLERLTLAELTQKLSEKLEIQSSTISGVYKKTTKKELMVRVDDSMVAQMTDELDMVVEYEFNQMDGSVNLTLKY